MDFLRDYFSRALDFVGEETRENYRKICITTFAGRIILEILFWVVFKLFVSIKFIAVILAFGIGPAMAIIWLFPLFAATIRRCKGMRKSKLWFLLGLFRTGPLILWFLFGRKK